MPQAQSLTHRPGTAAAQPGGTSTLAALPPRTTATITGFDAVAAAGIAVLSVVELQRRLLEMGFAEGARVRIEHLGGLRGDPIGVRLDGTRLVALRRREAGCITVAAAPENVR